MGMYTMDYYNILCAGLLVLVVLGGGSMIAGLFRDIHTMYKR